MAETKRMTAEQVVSYLLEEDGLDFLRESLLWVVQQLMEAEVSELVGAARGGRAPEERLTHRNGYRARSWSTRAGEIELAIPKIRRGSCFPGFLEPRERGEQALVTVVQEAYVAASRPARSTRWWSRSGSGSPRARFPASALDSTSRWRRTATGRSSAATPYVWLDARVEKVCDGGRVSQTHGSIPARPTFGHCARTGGPFALVPRSGT